MAARGGLTGLSIKAIDPTVYFVEEGARPVETDGRRFRVHLAPWRVATVRLVQEGAG